MNRAPKLFTILIAGNWPPVNESTCYESHDRPEGAGGDPHERERHTPEQVIRKLREAEKLLEEGVELPEVVRRLEISVQTYHRWKAQYHSMRPEGVVALKNLQKENTRLKKIGAEPLVRQRFSLAHEFKHILDAPFDSVLYPEAGGMTSYERAEQVADYFAACLLMPKIWMRRAWTSGVQRLPALARLFGVSQSAMHVRLLQMGLVDPPARCFGREKRRTGVAA